MLAGVAALALSAAGPACTFYTACPADPNPPANQGGTPGAAGSSNSGGSNSGGSSLTPVDEDKATAWVPAAANLSGIRSECGNMTSVTVKPDEDWVIAGLARKGLHASIEGEDFTELGQGEDSEVLDMRPTQITFDPDTPTTWWVAGMYGPCAYRTEDNGETFQRLGTSNHCDSLAVDFTDPSRRTLLAGGHEGQNVYKSTDGGDTWDDLGPKLGEDVGFAGFAAIIDSETYLVGSYSGANAGIYRTEDGGDSWERVWEEAVRSRPLFASDGTLYWVLSNLDQAQGLLRSDDQGASFERVAGSEPLLSAEYALAELPGGRIASIGFSHLVVSDDRGATWKEVGKKLPYSPTGMTYSAARKAFYIWRFDCEVGDNPLSEDSIQSLAFDYETE